MSRRSTLHPVVDPNGRTGIPLPSTVKKPKPNMRLSLAGSASRAPYPQANSSTINPRQSMYRSQNMNPLLMSTSKASAVHTPLQNSARRGSLWTSNAPPPSSFLSGKDTRPLRDPAYKKKMIHEIVGYMQSQGNDAVTMAMIGSIQAKDYRWIFNELMGILGCALPETDLPFAELFTQSLKCLRYPYYKSIDANWLKTPGSMSALPPLLGVLHWLVQLAKYREVYMRSGNLMLQEIEDIPEEFGDPADHQIISMDYCTEVYGMWLDGEDNVTDLNQKLEARYAKKDERVQLDLEEKSRLLDTDKIEFEKLKSSAAPIAKLEQENALLNADSEKFKKILQQYEALKKKLMHQISKEKADLITRGSHLAAQQAKLEELKNIVTEQNLSPEDVIQMTTEHETLARTLEDLRQKVSETRDNAMKLEVSDVNRAAATEEALDVYMGLLSVLNLFPPLAPPLEDIDLSLQLNTGASQPQQILIGSDIRKVVRPALITIAEMRRSERAEVENDRIKVDYELEQLVLECENIDDDIGEVEKKTNALNQQADDLRDAAQREAALASEEVVRLEGELAQAKAQALASGVGVTTRLQGLQLSYREQVEKVARLKEETVRAIVKNSHDIANFRQEVSQHLAALRDFAEAD